MDLRELENYRLSDAVKFNDELNPRLWGPDEHLLPAVRERLLAIADDFRESLGIDVEVKDITVSGSNAAYTYTPHSDIDLHLVVDLPEADASEVYRELFDAKKYQYNDQHDYKIGGYDVELYVQDASRPHHSQGIYSLMHNDWVRVPSRRKPTVDDISVKSKYEDIGQRIDAAIESGDLARMDVMAAKIREMRQAGLDAHGEFGPENLAFKVLRGNGTLEKLRNARKAVQDQEMSLQERKKRRKKTRYGFGGYYFPGYHYYGQTDAAADGGGDGGGGGESMRESTESQQDIIERFTRSCCDFLGMERVPEIKLRRDPQWQRINGTFGRYTADPDHRIELATHGRHIVDILRTLAHEITHARQNEVTGLPDDAGETGSAYEDSANAMAGRIMRHWAKSEPDMFADQDLTEVDSGQDPQPGEPIDWPEGTVHVKVSDVYDWYKLGQDISDLSRADPAEYNKGVPETILVFPDEESEERYIDQLSKLGLDVHDVDPGQRPGVDIRSDVDEGLRDKLAAVATAACVAGSPGCATTGTDVLRGVQDVGRTAQTFKGYTKQDAEAELRQEIDNWLKQGRGTNPPPRLIKKWRDEARELMAREGIETPVRKDTKAHDDYYVFLQKKANMGRPMTRQEQEFIKTYRLAQHMRRQVAEASGYIPTKKQRNDPRFSTALTVDVHPGQTGREANKLGLKTDSQGRPQLLMKRLNNLLEAVKLDEKCWDGYQQQGMKRKGDRQVPNCVKIDEDEEDLFEVKMSPSELEKWARSEEAAGIQAGFEAEMIFRDAGGGDEEDYEPDYDQDEPTYSIDNVVDFFQGGDNGIGRSSANRLQREMLDQFYEWRDEQIEEGWNQNADEIVRDYYDENVWPDEQDNYRERAAEELGIDTSEESEAQREKIEALARELYRADVETSVDTEDDRYDQARDDYFDTARDGSDYDESDWLEQEYRYMSDVGNEFGLDWPYWRSGESSGSRSTEDIADSLSQALGGAKVVAGYGYKSIARRPGQWIVEGDGSIRPDDEGSESGLEIVSPPMPLPETLAALRTVIDWGNGDGDAYTNSSTGLHMGISIPYKGGAVDYVKLVLFSGDDYVLDQFRDSARYYAQSALEKLKKVQQRRRPDINEQEVTGWDGTSAKMTGAEKTAAAMDLMKKNLIELAADYVRDGVGQDKAGFPSVLAKDGYIEFRSPGGDYLSMDDRDESALQNTMLRFARSMYIAGHPDLERKEYAKKLYKLIDPQGDEALKLFLDYSTGRINQEELKKSWARQVLAKEAPPQRSQADAREYEDEPEKPLSRRATVAKKISARPTVWHVEDTNQGRVILIAAATAEEARRKAKQQDDKFKMLASWDPDSFLIQPATAAEVKQYMVQQADMAKDSEQTQARVTGTRDTQRYRVSWSETRDGEQVTDSLSVDAPNADAAMDSVRSALQAQRRRITNIEAEPVQAQPNVNQQADRLISQYAAQRSQGEFTGQWQIRNANTNEVLHTFGGIGNSQADANRVAQRWAQQSRIDDPLEVTPEMR